jgi:hypothetical protein
MKKFIAILGALITGAIGIGIFSAPHIAEATLIN